VNLTGGVRCGGGGGQLSHRLQSRKRFSDFEGLHDAMVLSCATTLAGNIPSLPPKTWQKQLDDDFLAERQLQVRGAGAGAGEPWRSLWRSECSTVRSECTAALALQHRGAYHTTLHCTALPRIA
jgi:hypothetical protein